jgi:ADP-heptose:LPS heptosyltransferase
VIKDRPILVIKLGALGDFVQALGPFNAIRKHHAGRQITLLTTPPFVPLAEASGCFDNIHAGLRPAWWQLNAILALRRWLRDLNPERVYDLQTSNRSSAYFRLFGSPKPEWSGIAAGCSHPHANLQRDCMHTFERQAEQLAMAGVEANTEFERDWLDGDIQRFKLTRQYILLVPGGAPHRPNKRWPHYGSLAARLVRRGITPVILGTRAEREVIDDIFGACPEAVDLSEQTSLMEISGLSRKAVAAVGNDTGPMHLIAATGCHSIVLYSSASNPMLCGQRGPSVQIIRKDQLADIEVEEVERKLTLR